MEDNSYTPARLPTGGNNPAAPLYPNKLVEYVGNGEFQHNFHGVPIHFFPQERYGGRKVVRVNRQDVFHSLVTIPSGNFVVAEDLEKAEQVGIMVSAITEHADKVMEALTKTEAWKAYFAHRAAESRPAPSQAEKEGAEDREDKAQTGKLTLPKRKN